MNASGPEMTGLPSNLPPEHRVSRRRLILFFAVVVPVFLACLAVLFLRQYVPGAPTSQWLFMLQYELTRDTDRLLRDYHLDLARLNGGTTPPAVNKFLEKRLARPASAVEAYAILDFWGAQAGQEFDPSKYRVALFRATVIKVEILQERAPGLIVTHYDARWLLQLHIDAVEGDEAPFEAGSNVSFAIHSPSQLLGSEGIQSAGRQFYFRMLCRREPGSSWYFGAGDMAVSAPAPSPSEKE